MANHNISQWKEQYQPSGSSEGNRNRQNIRNFFSHLQSNQHANIPTAPLPKERQMNKRQPRVFSPQDYYNYYNRPPQREFGTNPQTSNHFQKYAKSNICENRMSEHILQQLNNHLSNNPNRQKNMQNYSQNYNSMNKDLPTNSRSKFVQHREVKNAHAQYVSQNPQFLLPTEAEASHSWQSLQSIQSAPRLNTTGLHIVPSDFFHMGEMSIKCDSPEIVQFNTHFKDYPLQEYIYSADSNLSIVSNYSTNYSLPERKLYYEN